MTSSTLDLAPREQSARGTGSNAATGWTPPAAHSSAAGHALTRASSPDYFDWLDHVRPAAGCSRPIRLTGSLFTVQTDTDRTRMSILDERHTDQLPDGTIYKACGNRRAAICPACARTYQRDAYQIIRTGLVGGKGVPATVATHPSVFATFTAPGFGIVHTRHVRKHTCRNPKQCDCRPDPCHARRDTGLCQHGNPAVCWVRHEADDPELGQPLCLGCYDHDHHVVWNLFSGELWHRTKQDAERYLARLCRTRGIPPVEVCTDGKRVRRIPPVRLSHGKAAEMQRRGAVHFHALIRLDGIDPADPTAVVPPPPGIGIGDLVDALHAAAAVTFTTPAHPDRPGGWPIGWGDPDKGLDIRPITLSGTGAVTDGMAAGYLAKYATKSTEATGHSSTRITDDSLDEHGDPDGSHTARLIHACWRLGRPIRPAPTTGQLLTTLVTHATDKGTPAADVLGLLGALAATYTRKLIDRPRRKPETGARRMPFDTPWDCPNCGANTRYAVCPCCAADRQANLDTKTAHKAKPTTPYPRLRRWAHMLGFGGHFLTKARRYSVTFRLLRDTRVTYRRAEEQAVAGPGVVLAVDHLDETTLTVGILSFAGVGWHSSGDALLANTAAAQARERQAIGREELAHEIGSNLGSLNLAAA
jgi:hypothetical protein